MLTPEQLLYLPDNLVRRYAQLEEDILADMAARISARDLFIPTTDWQFQKLAEMGNTYDMILAKLSAATEKTEQELREMMTVAASESLKYDDAVHKAAGKELPPLNQSAALLATLNAGMEKTKGYFQNLCRTTANQGSKQFVDALDRAYMQVTSGAFTKEQAIKTAVKDLASQGIAAAEYKNGRKMSLESAVRMNVVTGVNQTCAELQLQRCDEAGCDLVEVSAHAGARPSHAVWQGKLYSRSGTHPKYPDFVQSTGYGTVTGLCGANCRHNFYPFYEGISKRAYTHRELGQMNARTIRYNGQRLTEYEASQVQRKIERNLRRWKREQAAMKAAGQSTAEAAAKLKYWRGEMDSFIRQTGFKRQYSREEIFGKNGRSRKPSIGNARKNVVNRDGKEIVFAPELSSEKWIKTKEVLEQLAGEYDTKLVEVRVFAKGENTARAAGDVDPFGLMRLSSKNIETAVHEFAHSLTTSTEEKYGVSGNPAFWKELKKIRKQYKEHTRYNPSDVIRWYADDKLDEFYAEAFCHAKLREMGIISDKYGTDFTFSQKVLDITDKYFKKKNVMPEFLPVKGLGNSVDDKALASYIKSDLDKIPEKHRELLKETVKGIEVVSGRAGRYDSVSGKISIPRDAIEEPGIVIHELAHTLEQKLDLYHNEKFLAALNNGLEDVRMSDIIVDEDTFAHPIELLNIADDKFLTVYQRRVYEEDYEGNGRIDFENNFTFNAKTMLDYFAEGYRFYCTSPEQLKAKDVLLYQFIEELVR